MPQEHCHRRQEREDVAVDTKGKLNRREDQMVNHLHAMSQGCYYTPMPVTGVNVRAPKVIRIWVIYDAVRQLSCRLLVSG
jgi:hypothetical protein